MRFVIHLRGIPSGQINVYFEAPELLCVWSSMKRLQFLILFSVAILVESMFLFRNWPKGQDKENFCEVIR